MVAILRKESEAERFLDLVGSAATRLVATPALVEASIAMLARFGELGLADLDAVVGKMALVVSPFTPEQVAFAVDAFRRTARGAILRD